MTVTTEISKAFNKKASSYEKAALIQKEIGNRLFERLSFLKINPKYILDLGCGSGFFSQQLRKRYPKAIVVGLDLAYEMLVQAKKKQRILRRWPLINADMLHLPFPEGLFDLVFANQVIHWGNPLSTLFRELNRVMNVNACLMFTTLGPDTFKELKQAWQGVDDFAHANHFADMHDLGDILLAERFLEPVVDMEYLSLHYKTPIQLVRSLKDQGVKNINFARNKGLTSRASWTQFEHNYETLRTPEGKYPLSYEVVYGHAWKGAQRKTTQGVETRILVSDLVKKTRG